MSQCRKTDTFGVGTTKMLFLDSKSPFFCKKNVKIVEKSQIPCPFGAFENLIFEFVSDFGFRYSDLPLVPPAPAEYCTMRMPAFGSNTKILCPLLAGFTEGHCRNALVSEAGVCGESLLSEQRLPSTQRPAKNSVISVYLTWAPN
jgi:hypothetical protein